MLQVAVRTAACAALDSWIEQVKLNSFIEEGVISDTLRIENPLLRTTVSTVCSSSE